MSQLFSTIQLRPWRPKEAGTSEAKRHLRVARSLLQLRPNAWIEQLVAINSSCIALIECDATTLREYVAEARKLSPITGHTASDAAMDTNDAHFALIKREFEESVHFASKDSSCS